MTTLRDYEVTLTLAQSQWYNSHDLATGTWAVRMKEMYSSVKVTKIEVTAFTGDTTTSPPGNIYFGLIPSAKNTAATAGTSLAVVSAVRRRHILPVSTTGQTVVGPITLNCSMYECDLALTASRGALPVLWIAHTGQNTTGGGAQINATLVASISLECSGVSPLW